jgi:hypothetical protein
LQEFSSGNQKYPRSIQVSKKFVKLQKAKDGAFKSFEAHDCLKKLSMI